MKSRKRSGWRWYHHLLVVAFAAAMGALHYWLRPNEEVSDIILVICGIALVVTLTAIQVQKRNKASKRDGEPPRDDTTPGGRG